MKVVTTEDIINIDKKTIEKIPSILLMEHVASEIFYLLVKRHRKLLYTKTVYIFSSVGGNGGDGLAIARYLIKNGYDVKIYITGNLDRVNKDTYSNFNILKSMNIDINYLGSEEDAVSAAENIERKSIVLDSLFGTGGNRPLEGIQKALIDSLNKLDVLRIAIDIPSGLVSKINDNDNVYTCFKAHETYTICFAKDIFFLYRTREYIGKLFIIKSIFPDEILDNWGYKAKLIDYNEKININRNSLYSKREQGMLAIVAGSDNYIGAAVLAVNAAYRLGVGYIRLYVPKGIIKNIRDAIMPSMPEIVIIGVGEENQKFFTENDIEIVNDINKSDACIIGSGIGRDMSTEIFVNTILKQINIPTVIDADALYLMFESTLNELNNNFIITPHIYEFEKLTQINHIEVLENPYQALLIYREKTNASIVLKDAVSFLMYENDIYINYNPRESMGKAGMGDVFAGFIGALLARKLNILDASKLALIIQAKSFNILSKKFGNDYIQPKDLANISYKILKRI
ncbi:carbohydrate kinase [Brachyspira hyodysenteriae]|uniref:ADP-dependent (S)-NAD(P)H-hydrate dehydratase n=1 Tax=Brachyspira hyodysenteriae ATCC 27164 TaxID=1266923 RepID=A0A3B6VQW9_BRAHO|nr:NAD(P)H-hydrate dehydratase [Brachyspira hyodysenteriae]ANN62882.1 NAD(P)H-hydrate dehydratase [Brachyspira hyodysenteriae ATCC 27164]KLI22271.1 carbohydrate kinase [Brachyspira hyodysenteriae]MCZ9926053.1 NAD(P)H-hydrate dehydratase [Brachyspira hyodysenteriae]TVL78710.1 NAD(P)H-hydrate dehydratase [Brachyspira hyodysenteriae]TVL82039.1 NAD(P)H-hydrate dehydratase [Brachyspira hyodysenteriae]